MSREQLHQLAAAAAEALHAPAVKASGAVTGLAGAVTAPAVLQQPEPATPWMLWIAAASLGFTALTFLVKTWQVYREDRRSDEARREAAALNAAKLRRLELGLPLPTGLESGAAPFDGGST